MFLGGNKKAKPYCQNFEKILLRPAFRESLEGGFCEFSEEAGASLICDSTFISVPAAFKSAGREGTSLRKLIIKC